MCSAEPSRSPAHTSPAESTHTASYASPFSLPGHEELPHTTNSLRSRQGKPAAEPCAEFQQGWEAPAAPDTPGKGAQPQTRRIPRCPPCSPNPFGVNFPLISWHKASFNPNPASEVSPCPQAEGKGSFHGFTTEQITLQMPTPTHMPRQRQNWIPWLKQPGEKEK